MQKSNEIKWKIVNKLVKKTILDILSLLQFEIVSDWYMKNISMRVHYLELVPLQKISN